MKWPKGMFVPIIQEGSLCFGLLTFVMLGLKSDERNSILSGAGCFWFSLYLCGRPTGNHLIILVNAILQCWNRKHHLEKKSKTIVMCTFGAIFLHAMLCNIASASHDWGKLGHDSVLILASKIWWKLNLHLYVSCQFLLRSWKASVCSVTA